MLKAASYDARAVNPRQRPGWGRKLSTSSETGGFFPEIPCFVRRKTSPATCTEVPTPFFLSHWLASSEAACKATSFRDESGTLGSASQICLTLS